MKSMTDEWVYVVTDIEVDGPWPGANFTRSFASVAVTAAGQKIGSFEAVPGAATRSSSESGHLCLVPEFAFDGGWIDYYLRRFTRHGVVQGCYEKDILFEGAPVCACEAMPQRSPDCRSWT